MEANNACYFSVGSSTAKNDLNFGYIPPHIENSPTPTASVSCDTSNLNSSGRRTSRVWKYFRMVNNNHYVCCLCNFVGSYTNTTNMRKHIQNHHPQIYQDILDHTQHPSRLYLKSSYSSSCLGPEINQWSSKNHGHSDIVETDDTHVIIQPQYPSQQPQYFNDNLFNLNDQQPMPQSSSEHIDFVNVDPPLSESYDNFESLVIEPKSKIPLRNDLKITAIQCRGETLKDCKRTVLTIDRFVETILISGSEDGKLSSLIGGTSSNEMNDNSIESMDNNDVIDDHPLPPSPEQFLTEVEEASNHNSSMIPLRPESYKLRHNNHLNIVLESLADDESFMDVTLTAQGQSVKAHKSVLSAVSPYFKGVLKQNPCQHPIIIMPRDINFEELNSIIGYIYRGEITIAAEELPSLLKTAELLQVSGLSTSEASAVGGLAAGLLGRVQSTNLASSNQSSVKTKSTKRSKAVSKTKKEIVAPPEPEQVNPVDFLTQDMAFVKEEIKTEPEELELSAPNNEENLTQKSTDGNGSKFMDIIQSFSDLKNAPPSSSENYTISPYKCPYCVEIKRPLEALETHMSTKHPSKPSFICKICFKVFVKQLLFQTHLKICKNQK